MIDRNIRYIGFVNISSINFEQENVVSNNNLLAMALFFLRLLLPWHIVILFSLVISVC